MNCKSSWIDTALTHLRIFSACLLNDFQKDRWSAHLFFSLFLYFSLSLSLSLVGPRMNIKELRGRGKSGFQGIDFHRVGPNIVANSLVTVFSYYHDELIRRWMVGGMDEYWTNDKGLIKAGPNVECIASLSFHHVCTIFRFQSLYSFSTCFIVCYWNNDGKWMNNTVSGKLHENEKSLN